MAEEKTVMVDALFEELIEAQKKTILSVGRQMIPHLTEEESFGAQ